MANETERAQTCKERLRNWIHGRFRKWITWNTADYVADHITRPERDYISALEAAIAWVEHPFVDENTPDAEVRKRIKLLLEDVARAHRSTPTKQEPHHEG